MANGLQRNGRQLLVGLGGHCDGRGADHFSSGVVDDRLPVTTDWDRALAEEHAGAARHESCVDDTATLPRCDAEPVHIPCSRWGRQCNADHHLVRVRLLAVAIDDRHRAAHRPLRDPQLGCHTRSRSWNCEHRNGRGEREDAEPSSWRHRHGRWAKQASCECQARGRGRDCADERHPHHRKHSRLPGLQPPDLRPEPLGGDADGADEDAAQQ